jgi:ferric-dicitrate binding protein FerR (iron transport regulator)
MDFTNNRITELYAKKLAGEASEAELQELQEYLRANPEEQYFQEIFSNWWDSKQAPSTTANTLQDEHFQYIIQQSAEINEARETTSVISISRWRRWMSIAAAAVLVGAISFGAWKFSSAGKAETASAEQVQENEIVAKRGTKSKLLLPDGTQVWLNSDSKLIYNSSFDDSLREVTLDGEAYFDVVKDVKRPFIVHTSGINIRVLGTAFNVKSYAQEATIEATLVRGLIEVEKYNEPKSSRILLHPNEKLIFNKPTEKVTAAINKQHATPPATRELKPQLISINPLPRNRTDSNRIETSWVYGKLLFEGDSFRDLALKMERWFNVKITFRNNKVAGYRFGGVFENENIEEALHYLQMVHAFNYSIRENEVVIDRK